uniref:Uncharacterized protein n=1 Tax=Anguilla anguilla TaxID=7936 RepID=A0A0E9X3Q2_ANGAN
MDDRGQWKEACGSVGWLLRKRSALPGSQTDAAAGGSRLSGSEAETGWRFWRLTVMKTLSPLKSSPLSSSQHALVTATAGNASPITMILTVMEFNFFRTFQIETFLGSVERGYFPVFVLSVAL